MAEIIKFEGRAARGAPKNVEEFIHRCRRELTVFGADLDWDNWRWKGVVVFTKAGEHSQGAESKKLLSEDIMPFAKAYVRYQQGHRPTALKNEIKAIRCIEPALIKIKGKADITKTDIAVLDEAAIIARKEYRSSAYQAGNQLERLANFLSEHCMADLTGTWKNPISKPKEINRTGKRAKEKRRKKMLTDFELNIMADLFSQDLPEPRDRYTTSTIALAMCAPGRISEIQDLPVNCLHEEIDKNGEVRLGLRFQSGKGFGAEIKWLSTPFMSIAKEAVRRLISLSEDGRNLATWLEDHPDNFYRHDACPDVEEDDPLTVSQICDAMGWKRPKSRHAYPAYLKKFLQNESFWHDFLDGKAPISLRILNRYVHSKLPKGWPWKSEKRGIRYSNALFCMRKNEMHGNRGVSPVRVWSPNNSTLTHDLGPRKAKNHTSIWDRHGYVNSDGSPIKVTSHQFRHFLNTIAQEGDLGQLYIAKWSGRVNISQNRAYNHMSEHQILNKVRKIDGIDEIMGPIDKVEKNLFEERASRKNRENVDEFIRRCRDDLTVFGADLDWDNWRWKGVVSFIKLGTRNPGGKSEYLLSKDIMPFAKAYVRYQQGQHPTKNKIAEIIAIRCIEPALLKLKGKADITESDIAVLDEAAIIARKEYKSSYAFTAGYELERLAKFLFEQNMAKLPGQWKNPIPSPKRINRTGKKWQEKRHNKMISEFVLNLMADLFNQELSNPRDIYTTSTCALLLCAPGRISEIHDLPVDCLHEETDKNGKVRIGFRFQAGKGYGADIKWISTPFMSIAKEAVRRLKKLTCEARKLASWLEDHPDQFYRHNACPDVEDDAPLTVGQIIDAMGWKHQKSESQSLGSCLKKIFQFEPFFHDFINKKAPITLHILNGYVHSKKPKGWPWKNRERGIKYSNALFCMRKHELKIGQKVSPVKVWVPNNGTLTFDLGPRNKKYHMSIWDRHGYVNPDGSPIKVSAHQFRHFLNTIAQEGDLGQLYIAKWSGRVNVSQNRAYNHISEHQILNKVRKIDGFNALMESPEKVKKNAPVTIKDLNDIGRAVAHITEFGFCVHEFSMVTCQKHLDCLNCSEQVCIKGDKERLRRLKIQQKLIQKEFEKAEQGIQKGYSGADRWYLHQKLTLSRVNELIKLLESKDLAEGAVIRLRNDLEHSPLKREIAARMAQKQLPEKGPNLSEMKALIGGTFG
jgi:hypothetical protein